MTNEMSVAAHYNKTDLYKKIENGLRELDVDLRSVNIEDLALVDDFHIGGAAATEFVIGNLRLNREKVILDIGCGIGGPARYVAKNIGCKVYGIDLTKGFIETGLQLNALVGLGREVDLQQGSALNIPFEDDFFDGAYMIHVGMNIAQKDQLAREVHRVLKKGSCFVIFDVMKCKDQKIEYPLPWAEKVGDSAVDFVETYERSLNGTGFSILKVEDKNQFAITFFEKMMARMQEGTPRPLGLHLLMGENTKAKIVNVSRQIQEKVLSPKVVVAKK